MSFVVFIPVTLILVLIIVDTFGGGLQNRIGAKSIEVEHVDFSNVEVSQQYFPYIKRNYLMTKSEYYFYQHLAQIVNDKYFIIPQVALSRLVEVKNDSPTPKGDWSKINKKSVDFALFLKPSFIPVLVIELDDRTHNRFDRRVRDAFVDEVLHNVHIPTVHIRNSKQYNMSEIMHKIGDGIIRKN